MLAQDSAKRAHDVMTLPWTPEDQKRLEARLAEHQACADWLCRRRGVPPGTELATPVTEDEARELWALLQERGVAALLEGAGKLSDKNPDPTGLA